MFNGDFLPGWLPSAKAKCDKVAMLSHSPRPDDGRESVPQKFARAARTYRTLKIFKSHSVRVEDPGFTSEAQFYTLSPLTLSLIHI